MSTLSGGRQVSRRRGGRWVENEVLLLTPGATGRTSAAGDHGHLGETC